MKNLFGYEDRPGTPTHERYARLKEPPQNVTKMCRVFPNRRGNAPPPKKKKKCRPLVPPINFSVLIFVLTNFRTFSCRTSICAKLEEITYVVYRNFMESAQKFISAKILQNLYKKDVKKLIFANNWHGTAQKLVLNN